MNATIKTSKGDIKVNLYKDQAPNTVENFAGLAQGTKEFKDPKTGSMITKKYYDGLIFHRVIEGFMIQTGCPEGTGYGGPGYEFDSEIHPELKHDRAGILSMANRGPDTNGSQFFITLAPTPHLDGGYSVFGEVTEGLDVVQAIGQVQTGSADKPLEDVSIISVDFN
tara:strand:- start:82861 stop:83361 length:501 start_codon:yes stop_codon:yes gene_type:complete